MPITGTTNLRAAAFKLGHAPTNVDTQTYLFTSDIINQTYQSAIDAGLPTSWGSRSADYGLDPDVIGPNDLFDGLYASLIEDSLTAIPTISLTLDNADFFGLDGIYANVSGTGIDWERATSAELIFPDGSEGFQIDAGLRIHGAASRNLSKKNALRLLFKSEYGETKLNYPLFGESGVDKFDTIVLRPHFNDGWGWGGAGDDPLFIRDQWFRDTQAAMGHASRAAMWCTCTSMAFTGGSTTRANVPTSPSPQRPLAARRRSTTPSITMAFMTEASTPTTR